MWSSLLEDLRFRQDPLWTIATEPMRMSIKEIRQLPQDRIQTYERMAIEFLHKYERLHPIYDTVLVQHGLVLMWRALASH